MKKWIVGGVGLVAIAACAKPPPPIQPYMSAENHDKAAARLDRAATSQASHYNENARVSGGMCRGRPVTGSGDDICWTSMVNPTEQYLKNAADRRRLAAEHRAAAKTLRDAETSACNGIATDDRDSSPFDHFEDILRVEPLRGGVARYLNDPWSEGVVVTFREVPGMTASWLQRVVDCQIARNNALGHENPAEPTCLLVPKGIRATVSAVSDGFAVTVRAGHADTAQELFRRADLLSIPIRRNPEPETPAPAPTPAPGDPSATAPRTAPPAALPATAGTPGAVSPATPVPPPPPAPPM